MALVAIVYSVWLPPQLNKPSIPRDVKIDAVREHRVLMNLQPEGVRCKRHKEIAIITALLKDDMYINGTAKLS
jgi:hypothetical protein